jgi:hypothetical protein
MSQGSKMEVTRSADGFGLLSEGKSLIKDDTQ